MVDTHAVQFNGALDMCKLVGAVLFCIGGTSMAGCLLMSVFAKSYSKEEKFLQQKFKERIADIKAHTQPITRAPGPGETKIPVTLSRVQNVQPIAATWNIFQPGPPLCNLCPVLQGSRPVWEMIQIWCWPAPGPCWAVGSVVCELTFIPFSGPGNRWCHGSAWAHAPGCLKRCCWVPTRNSLELPSHIVWLCVIFRVLGKRWTV